MNKQRPNLPFDPNHQNEEGEKETTDEQLGQIDLKNVNARDFNFLSFAEIYAGLYNINASKMQGSQMKAVMMRDSSTKYIMPYCHFIGGNYWILKTTHQNRGIGIHVFKSISQLISIVLSYVKTSKHDDAPNSPNMASKKVTSPDRTKNDQALTEL